MGLEAISRGMDRVIFYEFNKEVLKVLEKNCQKFCKKDQYTIITEDILNLNIEINFDNVSLIYIDPPYNRVDIHKLLFMLQEKINKETIICIESSERDNFLVPEKLELIKEKKYGKAKLSFLVLA